MEDPKQTRRARSGEPEPSPAKAKTAVWYFVGAVLLFAGAAYLGTQWALVAGIAGVIIALLLLIDGCLVLRDEIRSRRS